MEQNDNIAWLKKMLQLAKNNLSDAQNLQKKHPNSFGIKLMIQSWEGQITDLTQKIEKEGSEED